MIMLLPECLSGAPRGADENMRPPPFLRLNFRRKRINSSFFCFFASSRHFCFCFFLHLTLSPVSFRFLVFSAVFSFPFKPARLRESLCLRVCVQHPPRDMFTIYTASSPSVTLSLLIQREQQRQRTAQSVRNSAASRVSLLLRRALN